MKLVNKRKQKGVTLIGFILFGGLALLIGIEAARTFPALMEYYQVERAIAAATQKGENPAEIRMTFDKYAIVNNISTVVGQDLEIEKVGKGFVVSVTYQAWINLFRNVNLVIEFSAGARPSS